MCPRETLIHLRTAYPHKGTSGQEKSCQVQCLPSKPVGAALWFSDLLAEYLGRFIKVWSFFIYLFIHLTHGLLIKVTILRILKYLPGLTIFALFPSIMVEFDATVSMH